MLERMSVTREAWNLAAARWRTFAAIGVVGWAAAGTPLTLSWITADAISPGETGLLDFTVGSDARIVITATCWASLIGLWRLALEAAAGKPGRVGAYLEGFFAGFLILLPAVALQLALASSVTGALRDPLTLRQSASALWPAAALSGLGSVGLAALAARLPRARWGKLMKGLATPLGAGWLLLETALAGACLMAGPYCGWATELILVPVRLAIGAVVLRRLMGRR
jgi:hypothetical protein